MTIAAVERISHIHASSWLACQGRRGPVDSTSPLTVSDRFWAAGTDSAVLEPPVPVPPLSLTPGELRARLVGTVRIGLLVERPLLEFKTNVPSGLFAGAQRIAGLQPGVPWQARFEDGQIALYGPDGRRIGPYLEPLVIRPDSSAGSGTGPPSAVVVNGRAYRGELDILVDPQSKQGLNAVNRVGLDQYLYGVVPAEISAEWHPEALKAQAVAARTYAVANLGRREPRGFDLYASTADQVYKGIAVESAASTRAVDQTAGMVITYKGQPINALFHANAGGHTEDVKDVWGFDLPYIKGVPDCDQAAPRYRWTQTFTADQVAATVRQLGADVGRVQVLEPVAYTPHGRVARLRVVGSTGTVTVDGNQFRLTLGLYSTLYRVTPVGTEPGLRRLSLPNAFQFDGRGWGHGLGMSQWGARQLAENGKNCEQILAYYYTGVGFTALA